MRILLIAFSFQQQYHTLRCAAASGPVYVLGRDLAAGLRLSRYCAGYRTMVFAPGRSGLDVAVAEIAAAVKAWSIEVVMPSDLVSTRLLIEAGDRLPVRCVAVPPARAFDELHDKWSFHRFCREHGIRTPRTWLFETAAALRAGVARGAVTLPVVVKPTNQMGGAGIVVVRDSEDLGRLDRLSYRPLLAQSFVEGQDCGLAMVCRRGEVVAVAFQRHLPGGYDYAEHAEARALAGRLARASGFHGILHVDLVEARDSGALWVIEANPRVWYSMFALAVAGTNFVSANLAIERLDPARPLSPPPRRVRVNTALLRRLLAWRRPDRVDVRMLRYYLSDPIPNLCERLRLLDDGARPGWIAGSLGDQVTALSCLTGKGGREREPKSPERVVFSFGGGRSSLHRPRTDVEPRQSPMGETSRMHVRAGPSPTR